MFLISFCSCQFFHALDVHPANATNLQQALYICFDDLEYLNPEGVDNLYCEDGPDTLDQARAQVFLDTVDSGGEGLFETVDGRLWSIDTVVLPETLQAED